MQTNTLTDIHTCSCKCLCRAGVVAPPGSIYELSCILKDHLAGQGPRRNFLAVKRKLCKQFEFALAHVKELQYSRKKEECRICIYVYLYLYLYISVSVSMYMCIFFCAYIRTEISFNINININ